MATEVIQGELTEKRDEERSIPFAKFISDVEAFVAKFTADAGLVTLRELLNKYNFMFESLTYQKRSLLRKIPDIQQSLETVLFIKRKNADGETYSTLFPLTDNCHAKAELEPTSSVFLWLGANVMLEYPVEEAENLLTSSQVNAQTSLESIDKSLGFLRDQITTTEVNIARVHNHNVKIRALQKAAAQDA